VPLLQSNSQRAGLSSEFLQQKTDWPQLLRNDYISGYQDIDGLFSNDVALDARLTIVEGEIVGIKVRLDSVEILATSNKGRLDLLEPRVADNEQDILDNATQIGLNATAISDNASSITDINDGRYSPQFGSGSPESVVTSNRNQQYFDTSGPSMWVNATIGVNTGWVQVV